MGAGLEAKEVVLKYQSCSRTADGVPGDGAGSIGGLRVSQHVLKSRAHHTMVSYVCNSVPSKQAEHVT